MKHQLIWITLLVALWHTPLQAQASFTAPIIEQLEKDGYTVSKVRRTLLGRILIIANNDGMLREVVINRRSGKILHDHIFKARQPTSPSEPSPTAPDSREPTAPDPTDGGIGGGGIGGGGIGGGDIGGGGFGGGGFGN